MKRNVLLTITALLAMLCFAPLSNAQKPEKDKFKRKKFEEGERMERSLATSPNVIVSLCMGSGDVRVDGWDKPEVQVVADDVNQLELQSGGMNPAQRVQVALSNARKFTPDEPLVADCRAMSNIEIHVPRGATIEIKTRAGDIGVSGVAEARIDNASGDISLDNVSSSVEVNTLNGDLSVADSAGRIRLRTVSGDIEATNLRTVQPSDEFTAHSTSGDIQLENVAQARLSANTTSGMITMTGPLAQRGNYDLNSFSGDVVLNIPAASSFRVNAKSQQGDIVTDFPIKSTGDADSQNLMEGRRLTGTIGTGDASLSINTFNGTVRLQKR